VKKFKLWAGLILVLAVLGGAGFAYWNYEVRWRPATITKHNAEITRILEGSGWASPGKGERKLYMVSFRSCADCLRFKTEQFPDLHEAGVDTREILIARSDTEGGVSRSTPAERATVAELWINRAAAWPLLERWMAVPPDAWTAPGIPPADGDIARTAVVDAGRKMVEDLTPLLKDNGIRFAYPLLIWWTEDGEMHGCACEKTQSYRFVRRELGV
jgi:hypothetical protein